MSNDTEEDKEMETDTEEKKPTPENKGKESSSGSVDIPEEAQKEISALVAKHGHSKPTLHHMRDKVQDAIEEHDRKEYEQREAERNKKGSKNGKAVPSEFSTSDMPA